MLTFPFNFLLNREARNSDESIIFGLTLTAGALAGFCIFKNDFILFTSLSYELSANDRPFDASRQAAIHFAYCSSCNRKRYIKFNQLLLSFRFFFENHNTYVIASNPHFTVRSDSTFRWHFQFYAKFTLGNVYLGCNLTAAQINRNCGRIIATGIVSIFEQKQMQIPIGEPIFFVTFQREFFRPGKRKWFLLEIAFLEIPNLKRV